MEHWYAVDAFIWGTATVMFAVAIDALSVAYMIVKENI